MSTHSFARRTALALASLLLVASCGDDSGSSVATQQTTAPTAAAEATFPITVKPANGDVTIADKPVAIVSLSPTATEMLFAIGAGEQVIAVDDQSNYPANAPKSDLSGFQPNVEAIAAQEPDLVIVQGDTEGLLAALAGLKIPTLVLPAASNVDDAYTQIELLGAATGNIAGAAEIVGNMKTDIAKIVAAAPKASGRKLRVFHELSPDYYSASSKTFIGQAYALLGMENIADAADTATTGGYPQLSAEAIVSADPDVIVLADTVCCQQNTAAVTARAGWSQVSAVRNGAIVEANDDIASRWGPRFVQFLQQIADAVAKVKVPA
ncbi:MAG: ABC transporter substrate-binding protein [Acidimicrobiia bacterium]